MRTERLYQSGDYPSLRNTPLSSLTSIELLQDAIKTTADRQPSHAYSPSLQPPQATRNRLSYTGDFR